MGLWARIQEEGMNDGTSAKFLFPSVSASFNPKLQPCFLPEMHMLWFSAKFWSPLYLINPLHTRLEFLCFPKIWELNSVKLYFRLLSPNNAKGFLYICYLLRDHSSYPFPLIQTDFLDKYQNFRSRCKFQTVQIRWPLTEHCMSRMYF